MQGKKFFERIYNRYNNRKYAFSDPISLVYNHRSPSDIEIAGIIASSLAYGNVKQILKSISSVFERMRPSPRLFLEKTPDKHISMAFVNFKHRFTTGTELSSFLLNIKRAITKYGSLENLFLKNFNRDEIDISCSIYRFVNTLNSSCRTPTLLPSTAKKSPFKRLNLFLRWMVRSDEIDLGVWKSIKPSMLIVPLDTHMHAISKKLAITARNSSSMKTALEITSFFRKINPEDPVKYDFALTRTGILRNFIPHSVGAIKQ